MKTDNSLWYFNEGLIYLNHGSFGATPKIILERYFDLCEQVDNNPMKFYLDDYPNLLNKSRKDIAEFINSKPDETVFVDNATTGVNSVLRSLLPHINGDWQILTTSHYYPAVKNTLNYIAGITDCKIITAELPDFVESNNQLFEIIINKVTDKTRLIVIDHISSISGIIFPIKEIIKYCNNNGILTLIDGAHSPGSMQLNLEELNPNWFTGNLHKWLFAPKGSAILYVNSPENHEIHPVVISNNFGNGLLEEFDWVGTRNFCSWLTVPECIEFYRKNFDFGYCRELALNARELIIGELKFQPMVNVELTGLMHSFWLPTQFSSTVEDALFLRHKLLNEFNIEVFINPFKDRLVLRISSQIYNTQTDYEILVEALKRMLNK